MSNEFYDVIQSLPQSEFDKLGSIDDFAMQPEFDHLAVAESMWVDRFGSDDSAILEGFSEDKKDSPRFSKQVWMAFLNEFHLLLCTQDQKYVEIRAQIASLNGKPATIVVGTIAAAVAKFITVEAGVLVPFVAILIGGSLAVGKNVACRLLTDKLENENDRPVPT